MSFFNPYKIKNMNEKNFEYLRDQVKYTGFGEGLEAALKQKLQEQPPAFSLNHQARFGEDTIHATLQFSRSRQSDLYFFNTYQVSLEKGAESLTQTFYINKGNNITLKEAYNLMSGRAVNKDLTSKEGQVYNTWLQMDFKESDEKGNFKLKQYHQNYGYDLEAALSKWPIKELGNGEQKAQLLDSLKKGNLQAVTFQNEDGDQKLLVEANPQFKTVNVYDGNRQRWDRRQEKTENLGNGESRELKQATAMANRAAAEEDAAPTQEKKKRNKQSLA